MQCPGFATIAPQQDRAAMRRFLFVTRRIPAMMKILSSMALAATIALGCTALARPAAAAPVPGVVAGMTAGTGAPVEDVRWVNRCRPQSVMRRDRYGRPVRMTREVCRRVWIDQRGGRGRY
jgi:hypothetical protein